VFDRAAEFPEQSNAFFAVLLIIHSQKSSIFEPKVYRAFSRIERVTTEFGVLCEHDHDSRHVFKEAEPELKRLVAASRSSIDALFRVPFNSIESEHVTAVLEGFRTLARRFEVDLPHALHLQRLMPDDGRDCVKQFHSNYVAICPLLAIILNFNFCLREILDTADAYGAVLKGLLTQARLTTVDPISVPADSLPDAKPNSEVGEVLVIEPIDQFLAAVAQFFHCSNSRKPNGAGNYRKIEAAESPAQNTS
jgi:hypothetical protein